MPYIQRGTRLRVDRDQRPSSPGELNYLLSSLVNKYVADHALTYSTLNEVIGALEAAKLEFYRRIVVPYEAKKMEENGDVYTSRQG